jgi:hypothetical protein
MKRERFWPLFFMTFAAVAVVIAMTTMAFTEDTANAVVQNLNYVQNDLKAEETTAPKDVPNAASESGLTTIEASTAGLNRSACIVDAAVVNKIACHAVATEVATRLKTMNSITIHQHQSAFRIVA